MRAAILLAVVGLASCSVTSYAPTSKALTLRELVNQDWKVSWPEAQPTVSITGSYRLRVSTYSTPPFIHRQNLEPLSQPKRDLEALCARQGGAYEFQGLPKALAAAHPAGGLSDAAYQAQMDQIVRSAGPGVAGMNAVISQMEQANAGLIFRKLLSARQAEPDPLTKEALVFAADQHWLGVFSCRGPQENWLSHISVKGWSSKTDKGSIYKVVELSMQLTEK